MKKLLLLLLALGFTAFANSQNIIDVFPEIPEEILFGVDVEGKSRLLERPEDTTIITILSVLGGDITRQAISNDFIFLKTSDAGTLQVKLLPLVNDSKIICVVKTVCGKACDSYAEFYSTDWVLLENPDLLPVSHMDWFIRTDIDRNTQQFQNAYLAIDMFPMKLELNPDDFSLKVYPEIKNYLSLEDYNKLEPYLIETPKIFNWDRISFK